MTNISEFDTKSDSISLAKVDGKSFTITGVERSDYEEGSGDNRTSTAGVKITVKLTSEAVLNALESGTIGPVKCIKAKSANGKDYFKLVDA